MKTKDVIRAWKDAEFRQSLSEADRASLPAHPSGMIELTDADLGVVSGGGDTIGLFCGTTRCQTTFCTGNCSYYCGTMGICGGSACDCRHMICY